LLAAIAEVMRTRIFSAICCCSSSLSGSAEDLCRRRISLGMKSEGFTGSFGPRWLKFTIAAVSCAKRNSVSCSRRSSARRSASSCRGV
jgi:hypothetical protein